MLVLPPAAVDLGEADAAIEMWEHYSRKSLDDTQRLAVQVMMAQAAGGMWAAATTGREMPRQNGKGDEIEVVELWGLVQRAEAILHTVHDAVLLATQTQQRMLSVLEGHPDLRRLVKRKWQGTGQQMIEMRNGGTVWYRTRTGGGGRGVDDIDRLVVDEAQHATEEQLAAVSPTLLANPNPQVNALGTAGLAGHSRWWWSVRKRALSADPGSFGYVGHTAEKVSLDEEGRVVQEPVDPSDRTIWGPCNPAAASGRGGGMAFLEEQFRRLPETFAREHLGVWDPPDDEDSQGPTALDAGVWAKLEDPTQSRPSPVAFSVVVSDDRVWAQIGLAGRRADGLAHLQIVKAGRGTAWVVDEMVRLQEQWKPKWVALRTNGPEGSLIQPLKDRRVRVLTVGSQEAAQACGTFEDEFNAATIRHAGNPQVTRAVGTTDKHFTGTSRTFTWVARGDADISPLWAVTTALHALNRTKVNQGSERRVVVLG